MVTKERDDIPDTSDDLSNNSSKFALNLEVLSYGGSDTLISYTELADLLGQHCGQEVLKILMYLS